MICHMMKCLFGGFMLAFAACLMPVAAAGETAPTPQRLAVVAIGDVPAKLAESARAWVERNLATKVDLLPAMKLEGKNLDDIAAQAAKAAGANYPHVVAIAMPPAGIMAHGMRTANQRAAVVNLRAMEAGNPDEKKLDWRIQRQVIRAFALMLDLETCLNPQCVLARYGSLEELDRSGRNCCPPCLIKFEKNAAKQNLEINKDSPFYIAR